MAKKHFLNRFKRHFTVDVKPPVDDKRIQYLIERFRLLGTTTGRWGLLFFATLLYTWYVSIRPKTTYIRDYVTAKEKQVYFDTLTSKAKKGRAIFTKEIMDSIEKLSDSLKLGGLKSGREKEIKESIAKLQRELPLTSKRKFKLKQLLTKATNEQEDYIKDSILCVVESNFNGRDILVVRSQIQTAEVKKYKDSLVNKTDINFQIPGITSINLGFKVGLIFWTMLSLTLLLYFFNVRIKMINYLKEIYVLKKEELKSAKPDHLDLQVPFWFCPITFEKNEERENFKRLIGWKFTTLQNVLLVLFLFLIFVIQLNVVWISWHMNSEEYFGENFLLKVTTILLLSVGILILLLWLQPVAFSSGFSEQEHFSIKRRELIKAGLVSSLFLIFVPVVGKAIPMIKGDALNYKRLKKKKNSPAKSNIDDGFYLHEKGGRTILHCFFNGYSPSFKTLSQMQIEQLKKKSKKISTTDLMNLLIRNSSVSIPFWQLVLEKEVDRLLIDNKPVESATLLLFALDYSFSFYNTQKIMTTRKRLKNKLFKTLDQNSHRIQPRKRTTLKREAQSMLIRISLAEKYLLPNSNSRNQRKCDFVF